MSICDILSNKSIFGIFGLCQNCYTNMWYIRYEGGTDSKLDSMSHDHMCVRNLTGKKNLWPTGLPELPKVFSFICISFHFFLYFIFLKLMVFRIYHIFFMVLFSVLTPCTKVNSV